MLIVHVEEVEIDDLRRPAGDLDEPDAGALAAGFGLGAQLFLVEGLQLVPVGSLELAQPAAETLDVAALDEIAAGDPELAALDADHDDAVAQIHLVVAGAGRFPLGGVADDVLHLLDEDGQLMSIRYEETLPKVPGFLDDYAFWAEGLLVLSSISDWMEPGSSRKFIKDAEDLARKALEQFQDEQNPGLYFAPEGLECPAPTKKKFWFDNAVPAGNSSMLRVFSSLCVLTGEELWEKEYQMARSAYLNFARKAPDGIAHALAGITEQETGLCLIRGNQMQIDSLMKKLGQKPHRPIFITNDENIGNNLALSVGKTGFQTFENCDFLVSALFDR